MKRTFLFTTCIIAGTAILSVSAILYGCKSTTTSTDSAYKLTGDTIADGTALVQQHCTKCHALVPGSALTKTVWAVHALPAMASYFSIKTYGTEYYKDEADTGGMSLQNWQAIAAYYKKVSPDTLMPAKPPVPLQNDWAGFTLKKSARTNDICFTTMVAADPKNDKIYTGDAVSASLTAWDGQLKVLTSVKLPSPPVNLSLLGDSAGVQQALVSCIGRLDPVDFPNGRIFNISLGTPLKANEAASELPRPVQTLSADFDKDGRNETVICGQGGFKGGVFLLKYNAAKKAYEQSLISERPGAAQAVTGDFNNDGWTDLMVLYGSGNEGLALYINNKKGGFEARDLLNFPPVNGSTSFQLADIDYDGDLDLVYTCGYNFRDSRILKPYHGLYIFENKGNFSFKQKWFCPINGCTRAIAADFDGDGDLDIATIAFFADMKNNPAEEFIYFEQGKGMQFTPHAIPVSKNGRWMSMDVNDINHDGKPDILLANYASGFLFQPNFEPNWDEHTPFIVLENHTKK